MQIHTNSVFSNTGKPFNPANKNTSSKNSLIDSLMDQRESLIKKRNALMAKTAENDQPLDTIQDQLKIYNQQIENLTAQIAQETRAAAKETVRDAQTNQNQMQDNIDSSPKTEEELTNDKLNLVSKLGTNFDTIKIMGSIKTKLESEANVTENQINTDNQNRADFIEHVAWSNPEAASLLSKQGASENKYDKLASLTMRISELMNMLGDQMTEAQQEIEDTKLQEKIQNLMQQWHKKEDIDNGDSAGKADSQEIPASNNALIKLDEAFKHAMSATKDFSDNLPQWLQEAEEINLSGIKKEDFLNDKLRDWEDNLQKKSPDEYESWKRITASLDITV
ncbi:hypothetical protein [Clostridium aminobutyricum]|uniref:Uncharacterized protein n=1 Tax=Clostridium aminobutyricum TaxID=33953 RepID=A0A939IH08_CLOAM|nr:hypothetical protein [Clostridium aminobutyricum]MBN7774295.1 hypothetical protein [Clostridium aminobutyricum]